MGEWTGLAGRVGSFFIYNPAEINIKITGILMILECSWVLMYSWAENYHFRGCLAD